MKSVQNPTMQRQRASRLWYLVLNLVAVALLIFGALSIGANPAIASSKTSKKSAVTVRVASMKGPTTVGLLELMQSAGKHQSKQPYKFSMYTSPDAVTGPLVQGKYDASILPLNLAATLYNKTQGGVTMLATTDKGMFYLVSGNPNITHVADLAGQTILSTGQGTTPQIVINKVLTQAGLNDQVSMNWQSEPTVILSQMAQNPNAVALLPEPFVSTVMAQNKNIHIVSNLNKDWKNITKLDLTTDCLLVRTAFLKAHPAVVKTLITEYKASVATLNKNPGKAAPLLVAKGLAPNKAVAKTAIPRTNLIATTGAPAKKTAKAFLQTLDAINPQLIGGKLPGKDFYYNK